MTKRWLQVEIPVLKCVEKHVKLLFLLTKNQTKKHLYLQFNYTILNINNGNYITFGFIDEFI